MKLWLDDVRVPPDDTWTWVKTVDEAVAVLTRCDVTEASLDHDLGYVIGTTTLEATGYDFCLWMAEQHDVWPTQSIQVHSANGVGARPMCGVVDRYGPYDKPCRWIPQWK